LTTFAHLGIVARHLWVGILVAVSWAGCGRVTVDPGMGVTRGETDAAIGAVACDRGKPFATPVAADAFNSSANDDGLSFSADGLTAYISSARAGGANNFDLFKLTRAATDQAFGAATALDGGVNTPDQERDPRISRDNLRLFYFSNHVAANGFDLYMATRPNVSASFGTGVALAALNTPSNEYNPFLTDGDQVLYFASDRPGGLGETDLYRAPLTPAGSPAAPNLVAEVNSAAAEYRPVVSDDGLTLYFDRVGGASADDIWIATRTSTTATFGAAQSVTELNTSGVDFPIWLSPDECTLYFGSDRQSGTGGRIGWDVFQATRAR
jgi:hypothetical protein